MGIEDIPVTVDTKQEAQEIDPEVLKLEQEITKNTGYCEDKSPYAPYVFIDRSGKVDLSKAVMTKAESPAYQEHASRVRNVVNKVTENLSHTLGSVGLDSLRHYKESPDNSGEYLTVAKTVNQLALALKKTGLGHLKFRRDLKSEEETRSKEPSDDKHSADVVYIYTSGPVNIGETHFDNIKFFIRPRSYHRQSVNEESNTGRAYTRQARTSLSIQSPELPNGVASMRIDPPSKTAGQHNITFDIVVGGDETNIIDALDLGDAGQLAGHHFESKYALSDLNRKGLQIWQVHEGIAAKLESLRSDKPKEKPQTSKAPDSPEKSEQA